MMDIIYRFDPNAPLTSPKSLDTPETLARLSEGNGRFADMVRRLQGASSEPGDKHEVIIPINPMTLGVPFVSGLAPSHSPYALVLGCSDARVPIEHILDCAANELFVVRVAGNVLGLECLGSVDYAVCNLAESLKTVIVLAHTGCGAVSAAVDVYLSPGDFGSIAFSHAVRSLIDRILLAVRGSARALERKLGSNAHKDPNYRNWLITTSVYMNAAVTAWDLRREVTSLVGDKLGIVYTVYDVSHTRISSLPLLSNQDHHFTECFGTAPTCQEDFVAVATKVVDRLFPN